MSLVEFRVAGYRSVRDLTLRPGPLTVLVGPNGCGKTNLYRALYLLAQGAAGRLSRALADEGGMPSALWAGERPRKDPARVEMSVTFEHVGYSLALRLAVPSRTLFRLDPGVKEERVWFLGGKKPVALLERDHASATARNEAGLKVTYPQELSTSESVLSPIREPQQYVALAVLCQEFLGWRFYHQFRTDASAPARQPQVGVRTWALGHDGDDLAAALQPVRENGDGEALDAAIDRTFPGARLEITGEQMRLGVSLRMPHFLRSFDARELSDGTLHYLCLLAALLSPRPPALLALNEPETSIHPDLLEPLSALIAGAARRTQVWGTTHSESLAAHLGRASGALPVRLEKVEGQTRVYSKQ